MEELVAKYGVAFAKEIGVSPSRDAQYARVDLGIIQ